MPCYSFVHLSGRRSRYGSKRPKTCEKLPILTQKCRFCARNARKWGSRRQKAHKNLDFVLKIPENKGSRPQKRTKMPILCSKGAKTRGKLPVLTQKCRFCARKARKRRFQPPKKHKNPDFVLKKIGIGTRKRGNKHREAQQLPSSKSPRTLLKRKCLIYK